MKMNLQYFGGRGSAAGKRQESTNEAASRALGKIKDVLQKATADKENSAKSAAKKSEASYAKEGKFSNGKTPSQIGVGKEMRLPSGSTVYKAASNKWAINTNGATFTTDQKIRIHANIDSMAIYSNNDIKRLLKP